MVASKAMGPVLPSPGDPYLEFQPFDCIALKCNYQRTLGDFT
jgi:hypothetical protein